MFRRAPIVLTQQRTEYVTREVHEHRAPTDESVRLLREMEQAADAKRIASMKLESNDFRGMVEVVQHAIDYRTEVVAVFDLNGKRCTAKADADGFSGPTPDLLLKLRDAVALKVANELLTEFARKLPKSYAPASAMSAGTVETACGLGPEGAPARSAESRDAQKGQP